MYGFYADPENACQIFHVCYPYVDADLIVKLRMFSFICGPGLVFDQEKLVRGRGRGRGEVGNAEEGNERS